MLLLTEVLPSIKKNAQGGPLDHFAEKVTLGPALGDEPAEAPWVGKWNYLQEQGESLGAYGWLPWALGSFLAHLGDCIIALSCRGFPGPVVNSSASVGGTGGTRDTGSLPGSGRSPGVENGNPRQCACLENPMDRGAWWATLSTGSQESQTRHLPPPSRPPATDPTLHWCTLYSHCQT